MTILKYYFIISYKSENSPLEGMETKQPSLLPFLVLYVEIGRNPWKEGKTRLRFFVTRSSPGYVQKPSCPNRREIGQRDASLRRKELLLLAHSLRRGCICQDLAPNALQRPEIDHDINERVLICNGLPIA